MAESTVNSLNEAIEFDAKYFMEYVRDSRFARYMGPERNEIFYVDDQGDESGMTHNFSFVSKLNGAGVTGEQRLENNEEVLDNYAMRVTPEWKRNGVRFTKRQLALTPMDLRKAARDALMKWSKENLRDSQIAALGAVNTGTGNGTLYADASETLKDAWLANNADRILFGAAVANNSSNDHSTSLQNVDNTTDKFTAAKIDLMKRRAKVASPIIEPVKIKEDEDWYVIFTGTRAFRDLRADLATVFTNGWERFTQGRDNPLFTDGDIIYGGCIIREIPEIGVLTGVGNGGIDVQPAYLCGASAVGIAWKQKSRTIVDTKQDYEFRPGVAVEECRAVEKLMFNGKQIGVLTGYFAGVADS